MKAQTSLKQKAKKDDLIYQNAQVPAFKDTFHQHPEIQMSYIIKGEGTVVIGDAVNYFAEDDLIILGENVPHMFKSDRTACETSHMLSLFFKKEAFGTGFFDQDQIKGLDIFFKRSSHGFKITSNPPLIKELFLELEEASKLRRFIILLELLDITSTIDYESLSSFVYNKTYSKNEGHRMQSVLEYTISNFGNDITLDVISNVANMSKNAFCKYFKKCTDKTYVQFLNEMRIDHACKLLGSSNDLSISEIAENSGFNNISNFNRQFKTIKGMSPSEFRGRE